MASKRRLRRQACEGKIRYHTAEKAQDHARYVYAVSRKSLHSYRCPFCQDFHLGHMPHAVQAAINERRAS